ncbi:MAG: NAD-dependent epimerase/dehydratase family protein [Chloroflexi bacterium]|nr:NAD-dependent epimerase/dehydratase family protein [Chloroflexota bacterium]
MNLVTGATGHIGNVLVRELVKQGEKVRAFILPGEDLSPLQGLDIEIVRGNILDKESLRNAMIGVDYVFHLAGIISIMPGKDALVHTVNVVGTTNILEVAKEEKVKKFIHTSSIHAFKRVPHGLLVDETIPIDPASSVAAYDQSKAEATLAVLESAKNGFPAVVVCPTGVVGPFDYKGSEMGILIQEWIDHRLNFLIEGSYDFVDVRDVVQGMILAKQNGEIGQVYILSGELIKVIELWRLVKELIAFRSIFINIPVWIASFIARFTQFYYVFTKTKPRFTTYSIETLHTNAVISNLKARLILGYHPRSLRESIIDTVNWWNQKKASILLEIKP